MAKTTYTAICFFPKELNKLPYKYRNVSTPGILSAYMKNKGAEYINFYDTNTKNYCFRVYLNPHYQCKRDEFNGKMQAIKNANISKFLKK